VGVGLSVLRSVKLAGYFVRFGGELLLKRPKTREARAEWLHRFCATALNGLGVELTVEGRFPARGALISNHLSYIDIVVYAAMSPCVFCSKVEIERWPVVGWLATMAGTVFVDRGKGGSAAKAGVGMKAAAEAGLPVVFFPEGTTTNGLALLPFHSGLLAQAMEIEEPVTAAYLQYALDRDNGPGVSVEEDVCYWGDRGMWPHVFKFLGLRGAHATVKVADGPIAFSADELHRKKAAVEARDAVLAVSRVAVEDEECVHG
jgi:1-acyl-sn-glycerol-3-phosphate acyltransferase